MVKVTVYIAAYNYARFIEKAIESVQAQTLHDWELIIINDGSTDNTVEVLAQYRSHPKIAIINQKNKGLNATNNIALRLSRGQYIMRLDADDYLDENALSILSNILDSKSEVGLVYPDYYEVDPDGEVISLIRRKKIGEEVQLLDLPAHGACTMFRKECLLQIGGYIEDFSCQDGYELWLRFIKKHKPYNVNVPLFYYRQHAVSLTKKQNKILETRRLIKQLFVEKHFNGKIPKVLGLIPVTSRSIYHSGEPFQRLAGKPLLWYTLNEATRSRRLDRIVVASDDHRTLSYASKFEKVIPIERPGALSRATTPMFEIVNFTLDHLKERDHYEPDAVCTLYINTPLRTANHIDKAVDTMVIFDVDSVVSIEEELAYCYHHRKFGLEPIEKSRDIRTERKAIFKENSAIYMSKTKVFRDKKLVGEKVGHITMLPEESIKINSAFELWLVEKIITDWKNGNRRIEPKRELQYCPT